MVEQKIDGRIGNRQIRACKELAINDGSIVGITNFEAKIGPRGSYKYGHEAVERAVKRGLIEKEYGVDGDARKGRVILTELGEELVRKVENGEM